MPNTYSTVQTVIDAVSQDARQQLLSKAGTAGQPILIDYTNRIHKQMLRFSRWEFLRAEPQYFMTAQGQTDYWLGPNDQAGPGQVTTGLNLLDVDRVEKDSVRDFSNNRQLKALGSQPIGWALNQRSGQSRSDRPRAWYQDHNDTNLLHLWPAADNQNPYQPTPQMPIMQSTAGGVLTQRTYNLQLTFVDTLGGESLPSTVGASWTNQADTLQTVVSPTLFFNGTGSGVKYAYYNVYAVEAPANTWTGGLTLQNVSPIPIGTNWTEPTTGLTTTGVNPPVANTLAQMGGYIIQFRYYKARLILSNVDQYVQIPDDYFDVLVNGISALVWKFLQRADDAGACQSLYKNGLTEMVWDKNLFPDNDFMRPDPATYVNQQILGELPETYWS